MRLKVGSREGCSRLGPRCPHVPALQGGHSPGQQQDREGEGRGETRPGGEGEGERPGEGAQARALGRGRSGPPGDEVDVWQAGPGRREAQGLPWHQGVFCQPLALRAGGTVPSPSPGTYCGLQVPQLRPASRSPRPDSSVYIRPSSPG